MFSVIVATRNRPKKIGNCLRSILANKFSPLEILVIDQSDDDQTYQVVRTFLSRQVKYLKLSSKGKSKAINDALTKVKGDFIAFTDDDCLVAKNWLGSIRDTFMLKAEPHGVFGSLLPYRPFKNKTKFCPCIYNEKKFKVIKRPVSHWQVGYGANMAFRREVFERIGGFREWLGPGTIAKACMDGDFVLRVLFAGYKIVYNPKIVVYHDRWLTKNEYIRQKYDYYLGEVSCYGYYCFSGKKVALITIKRILVEHLREIKDIFKLLIIRKKRRNVKLHHWLFNSWLLIKGFFIALTAYFREKNIKVMSLGRT